MLKNGLQIVVIPAIAHGRHAYALVTRLGRSERTHGKKWHQPTFLEDLFCFKGTKPILMGRFPNALREMAVQENAFTSSDVLPAIFNA